MKKLIFTLALAFVAICSNATIHNVDNSPNRPSGYFSDLQIAVNTAQSGDTLYVYPTNTSYGTITISKKLHLFGKGYNGTTGGVSLVEYFNLDTATSPSSNSSGTSIQGFTITRRIQVIKPNISNITVFGNHFTYGSTNITMQDNCPSWIFNNNYFQGYIALNNNTQILISNNVFYGSYQYPIYASSSNSVVFSHNLVMNFQYFSQVFNAIIIDNIFVCNGDPNQAAMSNNVFYNNLSWRSTLNPYAMPPSGNTGSNNISNQDPQFETALSSGAFDFTKDYHLKSTSPGKNAASDGTDIGPYGGNTPFVWGGVFSIPKITETLITNPVINQSTPINVNVKANKAEF